jgi:hypothetical protein
MLIPDPQVEAIFNYMFLQGPADGLRIQLNCDHRVITVPVGFPTPAVLSPAQVDANMKHHGHPYHADMVFYEYSWNGVITDEHRVMCYHQRVDKLALS